METAKPVDLAGLSYAQIQTEIIGATGRMAFAKLDLDRLNVEVSKRLAESAKKSLVDAGKSHGTVNLPLQGGIVAKSVVDKKVDWDSAKLLEIASTMPWDRVQAIFKITFAVSEKIYDGIKAANPSLLALIDKARTVKLSEPKITLIKEAAE